MKLSSFGERFARESGITELMQDIDDALASRPDMLFMGGGNPADIPAAEAVYLECLQRVLADPARRHAVLGVYQVPRGDLEFRTALASALRAEYGWDISAANIAIANGSQAAFFLLFNLFAGPRDDGSRLHIQLPLVPEYIGYTEVGIAGPIFHAERPAIEELPDQLFKYHVDFPQLSISPAAGALCVSRPTNPTGNMLSSEELMALEALAARNNIPLIVDGAYGTPFPQMIFGAAEPVWTPNIVLLLSLSKIGLPGLRTGIVIAREDLIDVFTRANTTFNLATGSLGPAVGAELLRHGDLFRVSREIIRPFYQGKAERALDALRGGLAGLPCRIHKPEGAMFLWLWTPGIPGGSTALYQRLKERGVLVVPGAQFFPGLDGAWAHKDECIRISYARDDASVAMGMRLIADEVRRTYG